MTEDKNIKGQIPPESLTLPGAVNPFKSPFDASVSAVKEAALPAPTTNSDIGGGDGGGDSLPSTMPSRSLTPELSTTSSFKLPRSVSRSDSRLAVPLELALNGLERPDGAREARILLPGVDLRQHFGLEKELELTDQLGNYYNNGT